jgi:hypothetical protein
MKKTVLRLILAALLLTACGYTPTLARADGFPLPMCWPNPCLAQ